MPHVSKWHGSHDKWCWNGWTIEKVNTCLKPWMIYNCTCFWSLSMGDREGGFTNAEYAQEHVCMFISFGSFVLVGDCGWRIYPSYVLGWVLFKVVWDPGEGVHGYLKCSPELWVGAPVVQHHYAELSSWIDFRTLGGVVISLVPLVCFNYHFGPRVGTWLVCLVQFFH